MHSGLAAYALSCDIRAVSAGGRGAHCSEPSLLCGLCQASDAARTQGAAKQGRHLGEAATLPSGLWLRLPWLSHEQPHFLPLHICPCAAMSRTAVPLYAAPTLPAPITDMTALKQAEGAAFKPMPMNKTACPALTWLPSELGTAGCCTHGAASQQHCMDQGPPSATPAHRYAGSAAEGQAD